ncbi:MAG TPA: DUF2510 domain-containing protein [Ilumatobacteraceae bacterium]|nr:DUF2510 domain-containing protein [Ilumatobacteraceae bacterium]
MRRVDAPRAGWYPDPENLTSLRYWDGLDWTGARRSPPSAAELLTYEHREAFQAAHQYVAPSAAAAANRVGRPDSQQIAEEVRRATRTEVDRAADLFSQRARQMQRDIVPLISDYTNRIVKWIRIAAIVAIVLLVAYFVFQVVAQASLFEWIGDRIDNFTEEQNGARAVTSGVRPPL